MIMWDQIRLYHVSFLCIVFFYLTLHMKKKNLKRKQSTISKDANKFLIRCCLRNKFMGKHKYINKEAKTSFVISLFSYVLNFDQLRHQLQQSMNHLSFGLLEENCMKIKYL